jgi:hypothetical protein
MSNLAYVSDGRQSFTLDGTEIRFGELLEVLTPIGWMAGEFWWPRRPSGWPLLVLAQDSSSELLMVILAPGMQCRRLPT